MIVSSTLKGFLPNEPDAAGIVSWVHIGDLHMTDAGEQNHLDLISIVEEINEAFADSIAFVYIPGDIADQGRVEQYQVVRSALDQMRAPWCSIIGDHDVHEKSFENYLTYMAQERHYEFEVGSTRFLALNAFDVPDPRSFTLLSEQIRWLENQLRLAKERSQSVVLLLHCYPTDLKQGGDELRELVGSPLVRLIDMGHTHYNEVANDGKTLYTATRSTGQIEEGPVGFSVTNIDGEVISWRFFPLNELPAVMITSPGDERFITDTNLAGHIVNHTIRVRAKAWGRVPIRGLAAHLEGQSTDLTEIADSRVWQGDLHRGNLHDGVYDLTVEARDADGRIATDSIRVVLGSSAYTTVERADRDQENAIGAWPERGLLGTQLGPNKNGRKW
jgi:Icc protein